MDERQRKMVGHGAIISIFGLLAGFGLLMSLIGGFEIFPGTILEFELPETPTRVVRCLGRVMDEARETEQGHEIGVRFETIRQSDRDAVVRYTLAVQRQKIRSESHSGGSAG